MIGPENEWPISHWGIERELFSNVYFWSSLAGVGQEDAVSDVGVGRACRPPLSSPVKGTPDAQLRFNASDQTWRVLLLCSRQSDTPRLPPL